MKSILLWFLCTGLFFTSFSQTTGDYQSKASGNWNVAATWQRYNGSIWVDAPSAPSSADGIITILSPHTVTNTLPATVDQVVVNTGGTLTLISDFTVNNGAGTDLVINGILNITNCTIAGSGNANITGTVNWNVGTISIPATLTGSSTTNISGYEQIITSTVTNNGTINWSGVYLSFNGGTLVNNNILNNSSNGYLYKYANGGTLNNNATGTFRKLTGSGSTYTYVHINNSGIVDVQSGILEIYNDTFTTSNAVTIASGSTFKNTSVSVFNSGSTISGAGTLHENGGSLTINNALSLAASTSFNFSGGTINGTGSLNIASNVNWGGGILSIPATLTAASTTNIPGYEVIINNTLTNNGTINWSGIFLSFNGGVLVNNHNFNNSSDGQFYRYAGGGRINNNSGGVFTKLTTTGTTISSVDINNSGTIDLQSGTLEIYTDTFTTNSTVNIASGATFRNSYTSIFNSGSSITGSGTVMQNNGTLTLNNSLTLPAATTLSIANGNINGTGSLTVAGPMTWTGGTLSIPVTLNNTATANFSGYEVVIANTLTNNTTINWSGTYLSFNGGVLINNNLINNSTNGILYKYPAGGTLNNSTGATFRKFTATGNTSSQIDINNAGTLNVQTGVLDIYSDTLTNTGAITIAANAIFKNSYVTILNSGSTVSGNGTLQQANVLIVNTPLNLAAATKFNILSGNVNGSGSMNIAGTLSWSGGYLSLPVTLTTTATATLSGYEEILKSTLTNNGTIFWKSDYLSFDDGTLINNKNFVDSATTNNNFYKYGGTGQFTNGINGVFQKSTSNAFNLGSVLFTNNGTIKGLGTYNFGMNLNNAARGIFAPGINSTGILTTGTGYSNRTLQIEMRSGAGAGNGFDQLQVNGIAQLKDTLKILRTGVVPEGAYTILTVLGVSDSLKGSFNVIQAPPGYVVTKTKKLVRVNVPKPSVSIRDSGVIEGNGGSKFMTFILTLDNPTAVLATVNFNTQDSTATLANNDYQNTSGTATFNPGESADTITVRVYGDTATEGNEIFKVNLSVPVNLLMADSVATGTITNNDGLALFAAAQTADELNQSSLIIPNLLHRNQQWKIIGLGSNNTVTLADSRGEIVYKANNYQNNTSFSKLTPGLYFYQVTIHDTGLTKLYRGKLVLTD